MDRKKWLGLKINIDARKNISNLITIKQYVNTITNITLFMIKKASFKDKFPIKWFDSKK